LIFIWCIGKIYKLGFKNRKKKKVFLFFSLYSGTENKILHSFSDFTYFIKKLWIKSFIFFCGLIKTCNKEIKKNYKKYWFWVNSKKKSIIDNQKSIIFLYIFMKKIRIDWKLNFLSIDIKIFYFWASQKSAA